MPKKTFFNLKKERQDQLVHACLREFSLRKYDDASISSVLKELKMAKGSFYQYFENKKDVFEYLIAITFQTKHTYIGHVERSKYNSFWEYWRALYKEGLKFDAEHPDMSNFAFCLMDNLNSPTVFAMYIQWQKQGLEVLKTMVENEVKANHFKNDIPIETLAMFLMNVGRQIQDALRLKDREGLEQCVREGMPLISGRQEKLFFSIVDDTIQLLSAAMDET